MSSTARPIPDLGNVIFLARSAGPAVWTVVSKHSEPGRVKLKLEHVETGEVAHRIMFVVTWHEHGLNES